MRNATLKDVAAQARVSTATVSRVLHGNGYVSATSRERVEAALRDSGYRLNTVAQELRRQRTIALGLIIHGLSNPFFAEVVAGAEHAAAEQDFNVLLFNARGEVERERANVETLLRRRVDGIVFTGALLPANVQLALDAGVSVVEIARQLCPDSAAIVTDDYAAARQGIEHLLALGHREIGYIGMAWGFGAEPPPDPLDGGLMRTRFEAYRDALEAAGIPLASSHVVQDEFRIEPGGWGSVQTGARYMERLLDQAPHMTATFVSSDILASGALQTLYGRGVRVPRDFSIVGVDDTLARHLSPPLTSVRQRPFELGFEAAKMAIELLADGVLPRTVWHPVDLAVRESTAPPPLREMAE
jgi:LacI family transcriptional regulator, galactose operon repressor